LSPTAARPGSIKVAWGAVFAGAVVAIAVQIMFTVLGWAIDFALIEPAQAQAVPRGMGVGAAVWWIVTGLISLFIGGWVAGRMAGLPQRLDAGLHGLVTWGLALLISVFLLTTAVGNLVGGTMQVVTQTDMQQQQQDGMGALVGDLTRILTDRGRGDVRPQTAAGQLMLTLQGDREAAVEMLTQQTDMTRAEAEQRVAQLERQYPQLRREPGQVAGDAADTIAQASMWTFIALVLGAAAAAFGGTIAAPHEIEDTYGRGPDRGHTTTTTTGPTGTTGTTGISPGTPPGGTNTGGPTRPV